MAFASSNRLDSGTFFPGLELSTTDGHSLALPGKFTGRWGIVLLYRGDW